MNAPRVQMNADTADYVVRRAAEAELGAAFALIPEAAAAGASPQAVFVACRADAPDMLGAAAFSTLPDDTRCTGVRGDIFVLPSARRRGVGSALLGALTQEAARWDVPHLHGWRAYEAGDETQFLERNGFEPLRSIRHFRVDVATADTVCTAMLQRWSAQGRIPGELELAPLAATHLEEAAELYARHFGLSAANAENLLRLSVASGARELSFELRHQKRLLGVIVWKCPPDELPTVDLWIASPEFRLGWPAMVLLQKSVRRCAELGFSDVGFHCNDDARATLHVARLINATLVREEWTYTLDVTRPAAT